MLYTSYHVQSFTETVIKPEMKLSLGTIGPDKVSYCQDINPTLAMNLSVRWDAEMADDTEMDDLLRNGSNVLDLHSQPSLASQVSVLPRWDSAANAIYGKDSNHAMQGALE